MKMTICDLLWLIRQRLEKAESDGRPWNAVLNDGVKEECGQMVGYDTLILTISNPDHVDLRGPLDASPPMLVLPDAKSLHVSPFHPFLMPPEKSDEAKAGA